MSNQQESDSPFAVLARYPAIPISLDSIARDLGLAVYRIDLGSTISGQIIRDKVRGGPCGFAIYINASEPSNRQRFSLAHEIAHYILHRDLIENGVTDDTMYRSSELSSAYETQANQLAADILMPIRQLKREYQITQDASVLANKFGVSKAAMEIRLKILKP